MLTLVQISEQGTTMAQSKSAALGSIAVLLLVLAPTALEARSSPRNLVVKGCTMPYSTGIAPYWSVPETARGAMTVSDTITTASVGRKGPRSTKVDVVQAGSRWCPTGRISGRGAGFCELN